MSDAASPRRLLLLATQGPDEQALATAARIDPRALAIVLEEGLAGAVTGPGASPELHRIGYPAASALSWFQVMAPRAGTETCASVALSRIIHGRGVSDVVLVEPALQAVVAHIVTRLWINVWLGDRLVARERSHQHAGTEPFGAQDWPGALGAVKESWTPGA